MSDEASDGLELTRRELGAAAAGIAGASGLGFLGYRRLTGEETADEDGEGPMNPLEEYPNEEWDQKYRDVWEPDDSYMLTCTPNDTHNCYLEATIKNGQITRLGPSMNYGEATDLDGNQASQRWDPRVCNKGLAMVERFYNERRVKAPMIRQGFKQWVDDGFPRDSHGSMPEEYARRGEDDFVEVSHEEAHEYAARTFLELADHYSGESGMQSLLEQGYDERVVEETQGAGVRTMKFRGGMPLLGVIKLFGQYRNANSMALLDNYVRDVSEDEALGAMGLDNYSFHTDLPPGHTMVTGQQTVDFDLASIEYADHIVLDGINYLTSKMADCHWLTEAKLKGSKVTGIFTDYNATASKCDELITVRPASDTALFLGAARVLIEEELYDEEYVRQFTDLPLLVRMDENELLRASDLSADYEPADLEKTDAVADDADRPGVDVTNIDDQVITEELRREWGDFVVHDAESGEFEPVTRDDIGDDFDVPATIEGEFEVELADGESVQVRTVFDLIKEHLVGTWDLESTAEVTGTDPQAIENLARDFADNQQSTMLLTGMGPNHYANADQHGRAVFLLASLTRNVGYQTGNVGSYSGNYRMAYFNGVGQYANEDPFDVELDPEEPARTEKRWDAHSAHFYTNLDKPLKVDGEYFQGDSHMHTPTKSIWVSGSNSILGNAKGTYKIIEKALRTGKIEAFFTNEWWWSMTCEYSDIVFPADSWAEHHVHDITASVTNPFITTMPETEIDRIYNTLNDTQHYKGVAEKLAELTGDDRFEDYWAFIDEAEYQAKPYIQRIFDHSNAVKGYDVEDLLEDAREGTPAIIMTRTYPKHVGNEQTQDSQPWYTKTGRLEFFREEEEFAEAGEHIPLHREPMDATPYEPNVIVDDSDSPVVAPETPDDRGWDSQEKARDTNDRQVRNVVKSPSELTDSSHPLTDLDEGYDYVYMTPKYRHGTHTFGADLEEMAVWWSNYGDQGRKTERDSFDTRKPYIGEGYVEMNPEDAREEGLQDGDYVWVDADPSDRPFPGYDPDDEETEYTRAMMRIRYQPSIPRGVTRSWMNVTQTSHKSYEAQQEREDGKAQSEDTNYVSMYRSGGHQSMTSTWLRRTWLTDTLPRKGMFGQNVDVGFEPDVHAANGAPKESFVKIEKAEDGGVNEDGEPEGDWRPVDEGVRPTQEDDRMKQYLEGGFTSESD
ncbi:molybdopterin-dependent oxidoreductase [Haloterrigena sp. SYSU A121-1]|uniref:Molybdopterin-dependent oxidoreductase n=1 Tax=Haloterrigena gelatinilytica TaxID=2741724 RepID=A0A8J8GMK9_9EURY|nr:molybdopterin-dependent oxidoreductase [Haloterrigena gelatinilytica]NUB91920.1 molybdopterin-dependent oxidoreductase [Haloterrigena gelatinilytica]